MSAPDGAPQLTQTDRDGGFVLTGLPAGVYQVTASQPVSASSLISASASAAIAAGERSTVALELARGGIALTVQLRAAAGQQVVVIRGDGTDGDAIAHAVADGRLVGMAVATTGAVRFDALTPGPYSVCTGSSGIACRSIVVAAPPEHQVLALP